MDYVRAGLGPTLAHDGATLLVAQSIRDSQVPVPNAADLDGSDDVIDTPSLKDTGPVAQILTAACLTLVLGFVVIVVRALW
jgi:hypothetical protein